MSQQRSKDVLFDSGAAQSGLLVSSFFQMCLGKAQAINPEIREYHPALADVRAHDKLLALDSLLLRTDMKPSADFSSEKLGVLSDFFEQAQQSKKDFKDGLSMGLVALGDVKMSPLAVSIIDELAEAL